MRHRAVRTDSFQPLLSHLVLVVPSWASSAVLPLHITPITLPRLHGLLRMGSSICRQRPTDVHFLLEVAFVVAANIPLVALVGLYQLSFRCHDGCSSQLNARCHQKPLNERRSVGKVMS